MALKEQKRIDAVWYGESFGGAPVTASACAAGVAACEEKREGEAPPAFKGFVLHLSKEVVAGRRRQRKDYAEEKTTNGNSKGEKLNCNTCDQRWRRLKRVRQPAEPRPKGQQKDTIRLHLNKNRKKKVYRRLLKERSVLGRPEKARTVIQ